MRGAITKRTVLWLAIISASSLVALAFLQYRWISQLGASERQLLDAAVERGTRNFREEFNGEITALINRTIGNGGQPEIESVAKRFRTAQASIQHPQTAKALYLITDTRIFEVTATGTKPVAWPAYLLPLRESRADVDDYGPPPRPFWNQDPPAVVLPGMREPRRGPPEDRDRTPPEPHVDRLWMVFEFDAGYIGKHLVPELIAKHFGIDYDVEVISNWGDSHAPRITHPDASTGFFEFHLARPRERRPGGPPRRDRPPQAPLFETPRYQLLVKHQSGSLDSQVTGVRHRNLAITGAVLLLMGLSSAALVVGLNRAEQLNRMQMDFVAGVSHELRTPLSVIRSAGENLADGVVASQKQIRNYGALVRDEGKRLSSMVEQILRFAGAESGRAPYTFAAVAVATLVQRALAESALEHIEVETYVEAGLPNVMADEAALSHCLQNLLGNAVKYGDGKWLKVEAMRSGSEVEFAVIDRGPGIDAADKSHLFDPFYRGKKAVSDQIHGLGIGLSLVKRVAEAHGGRADVRNLAAGGARFSVFIPVEKEQRS